MSEEQQLATPRKKAKRDIFLEELSQHGNISRSCRAAGIERSTVYRWKEHSDTFLLQYNEALETAKDTIRGEIYRRSVEGVQEPVWQLGKYCGEVTKFSDTLLIFHAKMLMPEYRDQSKVDVNSTVNVNHSGSLTIDTKSMTNEELATLKSLAMAMKSREENNNG